MLREEGIKGQPVPWRRDQDEFKRLGNWVVPAGSGGGGGTAALPIFSPDALACERVGCRGAMPGVLVGAAAWGRLCTTMVESLMRVSSRAGSSRGRTTPLQ